MARYIFLAWLLHLQAVSFGQNENIAFEIERDRGQFAILVPVDLNGLSIHLVLDTTAPFHLFDKKLIPHIKGPAGQSSTGRTEIRSNQLLSAFGLRDSYAEYVLVVDVASLWNLSPAADKRVDGVLGLPFLEYRVISMDFDDNKIRVSRQNDTGTADGTVLNVLRDDERTPYLDVSVGGQELLFEIATAFSGAVGIPKSRFDSLKDLGLLSGQHTYEYSNFGKLTKARAARISAIHIGPFELRDVPVFECSSNKIGMELIRKFNVILDLGRNEITLKKNRNFDSPFSQ
jgi:hypothetical protein